MMILARRQSPANRLNPVRMIFAGCLTWTMIGPWGGTVPLLAQGYAPNDDRRGGAFRPDGLAPPSSRSGTDGAPEVGLPETAAPAGSWDYVSGDESLRKYDANGERSYRATESDRSSGEGYGSSRMAYDGSDGYGYGETDAAADARFRSDSGGDYAPPGRRPVSVPSVEVPPEIAIGPASTRPLRWQIHDREPSDVVFSPDERHAYIVNAASGTLSVVAFPRTGPSQAPSSDAEQPTRPTLQVVDEVAVGGTPRRIVRLPAPLADSGTCHLVVTDQTQHELIVLEANGPNVVVAGRIPTIHSPESITAWAGTDGVRLLVGGLWSRQARLVRLTSLGQGAQDDGSPRNTSDAIRERPTAVTIWTTELDFCVGDTLRLPHPASVSPPSDSTLVTVPSPSPTDRDLPSSPQTILLTDRFGGRLALLDEATGAVIARHRVYGHAMRGLALTNDQARVLVAHQMVNEHGHTMKNDIHWGMVVTNDLRWMDVAALDDEAVELYATGHLMPMGEPNHGAADPEDVALSPEGTVAVAIGGMHEVALGREGDFRFERVRVARRPTAVTLTSDGAWAVVVCGFDDAVCLVDARTKGLTDVVGLGPRPPRTEVTQGRHIFHDGRFGLDGWMSCASCHVEGHSCHLLSDTRGDDSFGAPKRIPSLGGVGPTGPFGWSGAAATLEAQVDKSLATTQHSPTPFTETEVRQVAAFLRTLTPPPSLAEATRRPLSPSRQSEGRAIFERLGCADCHQGEHLTDGGVYDVGLVDQLGGRQFNPPSLKSVSQRDFLLHDGSAASLDGVLDRHPLRDGAPAAASLTDAERTALLDYLRNL